MANLNEMSQIRHNGSEIVLAKLNGAILYEKQEEDLGYCIEYTVNNTSTYALNGGSSSYKYGLPRIYSTSSSYTYTGYDAIEITLLDGTTTTDVTTKCNNIAKVKIWYPESTKRLAFYGSSSYKPVVKTVNYCKTNNFTTMQYMFYYCQSLTSLDTSKWNTSNVTDMGNMFNNCNNLTSLDVSNWDTSKVTNMYAVFSQCNNLTSIDVSNWDTSKVTNMCAMFQGCQSLTSLDTSNFNTSNVTDMQSMFSNCAKLTDLDVSNWDVSNVTTMTYMFSSCSSLTSINTSTWKNNQTTTTKLASMFKNCSSLSLIDLTKIYFSPTLSESNYSDMFTGCTNLATLIDSDYHITITYIFKYYTDVGLPTGRLNGNYRYAYGYVETASTPSGWINQKRNTYVG